jgi:hypothetical protein
VEQHWVCVNGIQGGHEMGCYVTYVSPVIPTISQRCPIFGHLNSGRSHNCGTFVVERYILGVKKGQQFGIHFVVHHYIKEDRTPRKAEKRKRIRKGDLKRKLYT